MSEVFIQKCLNLLKREDIKKEVKDFIKPLIDLILQEIYPYIYISVLFVAVSFLLILGIFLLLMRNYKYINLKDS
jgi:hypothetical protein